MRAYAAIWFISPPLPVSQLSAMYLNTQIFKYAHAKKTHSKIRCTHSVTHHGLEERARSPREAGPSPSEWSVLGPLDIFAAIGRRFGTTMMLQLAYRSCKDQVAHPNKNNVNPTSELGYELHLLVH